MELANDSKVLGEEIWRRYFVSYEEYAEIMSLLPADEDSFCYRCKKPLVPLTFLDPGYYYQPCWDCCIKRKRSQKSISEEVIGSVKDFYHTKILGDRYFQLFVVDPIYFKNTIPHQYSVFKKIINLLDPPSRNDIWFLDWEVGYPRIISQENIEGLKIINITKLYDNIESKKNLIRVGDFEIHFPELASYERHYSRYNIFNKVGNRKTKRIKVGDTCYRLYNTADPNVKSIFKLTKNGMDITMNSLSHQDFVIIKLLIMRNKSFLKLIFDIIIESMKYAGIFRDTVFLKNSVLVDQKKDQCFCLLWNSISEFKDSSYINLSII